MKKKEKILSIFVKPEEYKDGKVDITELLYKIVPEDQIEAIKYLIPSSTENGIYYTVYLIEKQDSASTLGF